MTAKDIWFDSHCHFDAPAFDADRDLVWAHAQALGVKGLLIPGISAAQGRRLAQFCDGRPWWFGLGLHPYFLSEHQQSDLQWLDDALGKGQAVAVGEIGLDKVLATGHDTLEAQWFWFREQVALARHHALPLILHIRGMHDEAAAWLKRTGFDRGGMVHAFSGSEQQARRWLDLGFVLGVGGAMTHPRAQRLRRTLSQLPADALLLETDSPDMLPAFWAGPRNSPEAIPLIAHCLAQVLNIDVSCLAQIQDKTRQSLFKV